MSESVESVEVLRDFFQHLPCGIHALDEHGKIVQINETEAGWLGYRADELIGRQITEFFTDQSRARFQEHFPHFKEKGLMRDLEFEIVRKDGTRMPVLMSATAVTSTDGFVMSRSVLYDMTARKRLEEAQRHLAAIVNSSDDGIISTDLELRIRTWNHAAEVMYGYTAAEIMGEPLSTIIPSSHRNELDEFRCRVAVGGDRIRQLETVRRRKDGHLVHVSLNVSPIIDDSGCRVGVSIIARDITKQRRERLGREQLISKMHVVVTRLNLLRTLLPVCVKCDRVRDEHGAWHDLKRYVNGRSGPDRHHEICPDCERRQRGERIP